MALRLSLKFLKKIQPGKILKKAAAFIPGGKAVADAVEAGLNAVKRRTTAVASGEEYVTTAESTRAGPLSPTTMLLIGAGILVVILLMRK